MWQEEEASLAAAAELLSFLTGAPLQPGGHFQWTHVLPPGSAHEGQHGQGSGLLSGGRLLPQIDLQQKGGNEVTSLNSSVIMTFVGGPFFLSEARNGTLSYHFC